MINEEEREKNQLNNIKSAKMNKGFELMLIKHSKKKETSIKGDKKIFEIDIKQNFNFLNKNISFNFLINFDIEKKPPGE
jgi:hypothetical protein